MKISRNLGALVLLMTLAHIHAACSDDDCNHGYCIGDQCRCFNGFYGNDCDNGGKDSDCSDCHEDDGRGCANDGTCQSCDCDGDYETCATIGGTGPKCVYPDGCKNDDCTELDCAKNPCFGDAECGSNKCTCPSGYEGTLCEELIEDGASVPAASLLLASVTCLIVRLL